MNQNSLKATLIGLLFVSATSVGYSQSTDLPRRVPPSFTMKSLKKGWEVEKIPPEVELILHENLLEYAYSPSQINLARILKGKIKIDERSKSLKVDRRGNGNAWKTVKKNKTTLIVIEDGGAEHRVIFYGHLGEIKACSANWIAGSSRDCDVVLLDGNLDGDFLDPSSDFVSWQNSPFIKINKAHFLPTTGGLVAFEIEGQGNSTQLVTRLEKHPAKLSQPEIEIVDMLNSARLAVGLAPVTVDLEITKGCRQHVEYLHHHDPNKIGNLAEGGLGDFIREDETREKYTPEGNRASMNGVVHYLSPSQPASTIIDGSYRGTHLRQRIGLPGRMKFGASQFHSWVVASSSPASEVSEPGFTLIPAPGQINVPTTCSGGWPSPESHPQIYLQPRGFPISFTPYGKSEQGQSSILPNLFSSSTITLSELKDGVLVPGFSYTNSDIFATNPTTTWFFVPAKPLEFGVEYVVNIHAIPMEWALLPDGSHRKASDAIRFSYSFKTKPISKK